MVLSDGCGGQTADTKKEEFRNFLEKAGVIDALTKGVSPIDHAPI